MIEFWKNTVKNRGIGLCKHSETGRSMARVAGEQRAKKRGEKMKTETSYTTLRISDFIQRAVISIWRLSSTLCFIKLRLLCGDWFGGRVSPMVWRGKNMTHRTGGLWFWLETIVEAKKWKNRFLSSFLTPLLLLSLFLSPPLSFPLLHSFLSSLFPFSKHLDNSTKNYWEESRIEWKEIKKLKTIIMTWMKMVLLEIGRWRWIQRIFYN